MEHAAGGLADANREAGSVPPVTVGEYLCTERDLYRVEQLGSNERALIEDCRTGDLLDVPLSELRLLRHVRRT